jgi:hypothetical protein
MQKANHSIRIRPGGGCPMLDLKRKYVVDEKNRRIAVQIDIETFEKIEEALENYGLARIMEVNHWPS